MQSLSTTVGEGAMPCRAISTSLAIYTQPGARGAGMNRQDDGHDADERMKEQAVRRLALRCRRCGSHVLPTRMEEHRARCGSPVKQPQRRTRPASNDQLTLFGQHLDADQ